METKTIYLRARYYSPEIGRFTQEDTYHGSIADPLSLNLYTYCNNNPVIYHDPTGHFLALVAVAAAASTAKAPSSSSSSSGGSATAYGGGTTGGSSSGGLSGGSIIGGIIGGIIAGSPGAALGGMIGGALSGFIGNGPSSGGSLGYGTNPSGSGSSSGGLGSVTSEIMKGISGMLSWVTSTITRIRDSNDITSSGNSLQIQKLSNNNVTELVAGDLIINDYLIGYTTEIGGETYLRLDELAEIFGMTVSYAGVTGAVIQYKIGTYTIAINIQSNAGKQGQAFTASVYNSAPFSVTTSIKCSLTDNGSGKLVPLINGNDFMKLMSDAGQKTEVKYYLGDKGGTWRPDNFSAESAILVPRELALEWFEENASLLSSMPLQSPGDILISMFNNFVITVADWWMINNSTSKFINFRTYSIYEYDYKTGAGYRSYERMVFEHNSDYYTISGFYIGSFSAGAYL